MSSILPNKISDLISFCDLHGTVWQAAPPAAIGISAAQVTAFKANVLAAQGFYNARQNQEEVFRAAVTKNQDGAKVLRDNAAELLKLIKAYASTQANPNTVYTTAQIPPPAVPSPAPPPGTPGKFRVSLNPADGSVTVRFVCQNPTGTSGTLYLVKRKLAGEMQYTPLSPVHNKQFTDATIPAGTASVVYTVQAVRAGTAGEESTPFEVSFGTAGAGLAASVEGRMMRAAA